MRNLMMDIETLSLENNAVVVSLAILNFPFSRKNLTKVSTYEELEAGAFVTTFETQDQIDKGRHISSSTIAWWLNQGEKARETFAEDINKGEKAKDNIQTLKNLSYFISSVFDQTEEVRLWGWPATFDCTILKSLYTDYGITYPVAYWQNCDVRTLIDMVEDLGIVEVKEIIKKPRIPHDPLSDAIAQAQALQDLKLRFLTAT